MDAADIARLATHSPRLSLGVDLDAHLRLLRKDATCKGLFIADALAILKRAHPAEDACALAEIPARRYVPFLDYPYGDYLRAVVAAARRGFSGRSLGEGVFSIGRAAYGAFAENRVGKVLFGALGRDFDRIAELGTRGWQVSANFGSVRYVPLARRRAAYVFREFPAFLETLQAGVVQGAMDATQTKGEVSVHLDDLQTGVIEMRWE